MPERGLNVRRAGSSSNVNVALMPLALQLPRTATGTVPDMVGSWPSYVPLALMVRRAGLDPQALGLAKRLNCEPLGPPGGPSCSVALPELRWHPVAMLPPIRSVPRLAAAAAR